MQRIFILFVLYLSFSLHLDALNFQNEKDSLNAKSKSYKNKISLEIIGNPLSLSYEREFYNKGKISLTGHLGLNLPIMLFTRNIPGVSFGMNTSIKMHNRWSFFALTKFDFLAINFPAKSWHRYKQGDIISFNIISLNTGTGICYRKKHWEIAPLYPCFMYSIGLVGDGEDGWAEPYPSISFCSKIAYKF